MKVLTTHESILLRPFFWLAAAIASVSLLTWYLIGPAGLWPDSNSVSLLERDWGLIPLAFEANIGQSNNEVAYLARGNGYTLFLTPAEAGMVVWTAEPIGDEDERLTTGQAAAFNIQFIGANPAPTITGEDQQEGRVSYLVGAEAEDWVSDIPTFGKVKYEALYPGIDLVFYGNGQQLEYDFIVSPGADPSQIRLNFAGVEGLYLDESGNLVLETAAGEVLQRAPFAYQELNNIRQKVGGHFKIFEGNEVGFELETYDDERPLIIDPIVYSTFLGGSGFDLAYDVAVDANGAAYMTGIVTSPDFPIVPGGYSVPNPGGYVAKVNPTGTALEYTAFISGTGNAIDVDSAGNAYVGGYDYYGFIHKLNAAGTDLIYNTTIAKEVLAVAVGPNDHLFVTGETEGVIDFTPTPGAFQTSYGGWYSDAFVARIDSSGGMVYGSFLGGEYDDYGEGIAVDAAGFAYVTGSTYSNQFPTANAFQNNKAGSYDAIVTKVSPDGSSLIYSTYIGGTDRDHAYDIVIDSNNRPHITGYTHSWNSFPLQNPYQSTMYASDTFVSKFASDGGSLEFSTFLGGGTINGSVDEGRAIALDSVGNVIVAGRTEVTNFPVTADAPQPYYAGDFYDVILFKFSPDGQNLLFSTYLGGVLTDEAWGLDVDNNDAIYVAGDTSSFEFPTVNPMQSTIGISADQRVDAFLTKFDAAAPAGPLVDLSVSMVDSSNVVHGGDPVTYTITLHNNGPHIATNVEYAGRFPFLNVGGVTPSQGSCSPIFAVYHVICDIGTIPVGASVNIIALVYAPNVNGGSMSIDGFIYSDQLDTNNLDNNDREVTLISDDIFGLSVNVAGNGSVVSTNVLGIDCPGDCFENYVGGQGVMLVVIPGPGAQFVGWQDDCSGTNTQCTVTMSQNHTVSAVFSGGSPPTPTATAVPPTPTGTSVPPTPTPVPSSTPAGTNQNGEGIIFIPMVMK